MGQTRIRKVKPGDCIREKEYIRDGVSYQEREKVYRVIKVYPHHVLAADTRTGCLRGICYGDLICQGLEEQPLALEVLRYHREEREGKWKI